MARRIDAEESFTVRRQVVWLTAACALLLVAALVSLGAGAGQDVRTVDGHRELAETGLPTTPPEAGAADPGVPDPVAPASAPEDAGTPGPALAGSGATVAAPAPEERRTPESPPADPPAPDTEPVRRGATHVRLLVTATTTADWSTVALDGLKIVDHVVRSGAAEVAAAEATLILPSGPAHRSRSAAFDLLLAVAADTSPALVIDQAPRPGTATNVLVQRVAPDGGRATIAEALADGSDGAAAAVTVPLDRAALTAAPIDLGPTDADRLAVMMVHPWWDGSEADRFGPADPIGAWTWDDPADAAAQVDTIAGLGVDAIAFSFGFPDDLAGDPMITNLIDAVVADGRLRLLPLIELDAAYNNPAVIDRQIAQAWGFARSHREQFVWRGGAPVFFFYGDERLASFAWNDAISRSQNRGEPVYAITGAVEEGRHRSGAYRYSLAGSAPSAITQDVLAQTYRTRVRHVLRPELGPPQLSVGSVSPGYDERLIAGRGRQLFIPRDDGRRYDQAWEAALAGDPDWMFISTWDEWFEQSHVHPDTEHGDRAYRQTVDWVARFHAGG
ncbi:hypothetical protein BH20ACT2_BH20ACT2_21160 [soil metagenome]